MTQRALASVNLAAIERNVQRLRAQLGRARLCAVVKADGYGHGATAVAHAAQAAGANWLAVATASEAAELRAAGIGGPLLVMGALSHPELEVALEAGAELVAWTPEFVRAALAVAPEGELIRFHVKLDTGMGRLGTRDPARALEVAERILSAGGGATLVGAMTHFATADEDPEFMAEQLDRFLPFVEVVRRRCPDLLAHAANSAAALRDPVTHLDMARCGIALYGLDPMNHDAGRWGLEPALELTSYLAVVKATAPGESAGYGRQFIAAASTFIATAPIGYADGIRRDLTNRSDVLVAGRRARMAGTVSMDNVTIDLGPEPGCRVGEPVTIIGTQGAERVSAEELARCIGTINYEILCGITARVPRRWHRDGAAP